MPAHVGRKFNWGDRYRTLFIYLKSKCLFRKLKRILIKSMQKTKCITEIDERGTSTHQFNKMCTPNLINLCGKEVL